MLQIAQRMQMQLLPLGKYSGKGERNEAKFNDFIEEFKMRYGYETEATKIRYLHSYLTGLALDSFLGIPTHVREKGTFEEVVHSLRKATVDSSRITRIELQNNLSKMEWRKGQPLIELFAHIDRRVAAAYPGSIYSDPYFIDEKCGIAIQALRVNEDLATGFITAVSQTKNGELYKGLKIVALEYERARKSVKKAPSHKRYSRTSAGSERSSPKNGTLPPEISSKMAAKDEGCNEKERKLGGSNAVWTKGGNSKQGSQKDEVTCFVRKGRGHMARVCPTAAIHRLSNVKREEAGHPKGKKVLLITIRVQKLAKDNKPDPKNKLVRTRLTAEVACFVCKVRGHVAKACPMATVHRFTTRKRRGSYTPQEERARL
ncbi:unnamed protein product [Gongylonema pulchrum]|uniref:CCHC-type domain-containing protein n=1 Tax=Gongylonema pulchrum TaxID=637853 RepID=A0A183D5U4_9BILA|nr:unnamed protein product [Gongylonema pulchrum]